MTTHAVIYGEGAQTIKTVPTGLDGEPILLASAEARIVDLLYSEDSDDRVIVAKAAATVDSTTDTTTAAVGAQTANSRRIPVGTPGNFSEGSSYALVDTDGQVQEIVCERVDSTYVYARDDIRYNFTSGSTLRGIEVSVTFPALEANDEESFDVHKECPYAVDWYFGSGLTGPVRELIYFRRSPRSPLARVADVELLDSTVGMLNKRGNKVEKALEQAHRDFWRLVESHDVDTDTIVSGNFGRDWVTYRAAEILRRTMGTDRDDDIAMGYARVYGGIFKSIGKQGSVSLNRGTDQADRDHNQPFAWILT